MAWEDPRFNSRSARRSSRSMGRLLNISIGVVVVAIIFVGGYLLYSVMNAPEPSAKTAASAQSTPSSTKGTAASTNQRKGADTSQTTSGDASSNSNANSDSSSTTHSSSDQNQTDGTTSGAQATTSDAYHFVGGGPAGPWEPIGTVQTEPHTTDYTQGSVDWNERIKALLYATNINDNDYILWRLENGGSPDKSKGIISEKETPNDKYDVMLQWVTNKGWEPISVTKEADSSSSASSSSSQDTSNGSSGN